MSWGRQPNAPAAWITTGDLLAVTGADSLDEMARVIYDHRADVPELTWHVEVDDITSVRAWLERMQVLADLLDADLLNETIRRPGKLCVDLGTSPAPGQVKVLTTARMDAATSPNRDPYRPLTIVARHPGLWGTRLTVDALESTDVRVRRRCHLALDTGEQITVRADHDAPPVGTSLSTDELIVLARHPLDVPWQF